jgi:hypothetical protein
MPKEIPSAKRKTVTLSDDSTVVVQEFSTSGVILSLGDINRVLKRTRAAGSLDAIFDSFKDEDRQGIDKFLDAVTTILSVFEDEPDILPRMISRCLVGEHWSERSVDDFLLADLVALIRAVYEVNWVEGSLKKALKLAGVLKESEDSATPQKTPSETQPATPKAEPSLTGSEASTS